MPALHVVPGGIRGSQTSSTDRRTGPVFKTVLTLAASTAVCLLGMAGSSMAALVGHWEFDNSGDVGQATFSSDLEAVGDAAYSASGKIGGALALDGAGDYLRVDASHTLPSGLPTGDTSFTIAAFVQTSANARNTITFWGNFSTAQANGFRTTTSGEPSIADNSTGGLLDFGWGAEYDYGVGAGGTPPGTIYDGQWHHAAVTYDAATSTKRLYFDGVEIGTGKVIPDLNIAAANFGIGARTGSEPFNGLIDDVRVYDNALSQSEILALSNAGGGPDTTPPEISSLVPADGETEVPISGDLVATFNEPVQAGASGNITIHLASDDSVVETFDVTSSPRLSFGGSSVTIDPTADLLGGVDYYVLINAGAIEDSAGNGFAGISAPPDPSKWSFTADATPPTSSVLDPVAGSDGVSPSIDLTLTFGENVQLGTGNITIHRASDGTVVETIDVTGGAVTIVGTEVTIDIGALAFGTSYYVNIAAGAFTDLSGNAYAGITDTSTWTFTTEPAVLPFGTLSITRSGENLRFEWPGTSGMIYNLLSDTDLTRPVGDWSAYDNGTTTYSNIPSSGNETQVLEIPMPADPARFFAVSEYPSVIDAQTLAEWSAPYRNWHYHPDHVIPANPNIAGYNISLTDVPTVFQIPGDPKYYMTFVGFDGGGYQSFIAESTDLVAWTNRRLAMPYGPAGAFDYGGVVLGAYLYESYDIKAPRTIKLKDGKFWSLYGAYDQRTGYEAGVGSNGLASSIDGVNWSRVQNDPIVSIYDDDAGAWESNVIYMPWLIEHEGTYYNHYNAKGGPEQIGMVTSGDLLTWARYENNPVIPVGASPYNTAFSADPKIFWDRDHWVCFFFGVGSGGAHIMAAFSRDLYDWTVDPTPLYLAGGNPSGLDSTYAHKISLVWNPANETYYMYYCAVGNQGRGIGLITSKPLSE